MRKVDLFKFEEFEEQDPPFIQQTPLDSFPMMRVLLSDLGG